MQARRPEVLPGDAAPAVAELLLTLVDALCAESPMMTLPYSSSLRALGPGGVAVRPRLSLRGQFPCGRLAHSIG